jgi:hypothetical protein
VIDLLDRERRRGRIDEASFLVGRQIERVFEQMHHRARANGQSLDANGINGFAPAELQLVPGLERAFEHLGPLDARLLWLVLGNRQSLELAALALWPQRKGVRGLHYTIDRFREALSALAEAKAEKGRARCG